LPIGPFPDFDACLAHMTKPKSEGGGGYDEETAKKVCGKMKAELEESFSWTSEFEILKPAHNLIRGKAIHPIKTFHSLEWPQLRVYLEEELEKSAETLVGKPLFLDHWRPLKGKVLGARYEDGALEYIAELNDEDILRLIRDGQIKHASVQFEWKILEQVDGVAPRGLNFQHLSLLKDMQPGDPQTTVEILESVARQLKEAKGLAPPNPQGSETEKKEESKLSEQIVEPSIEDRVKGLEQSIENIYSRIMEVEGVLTAKIETLLALVPHVESTKEAEWTAEYINDLDDNCFAYIEPGGEKDEQGKTTPRSLRHFPYKNAQGNLSPDHVRNGLARLGQELGDWATADAKAQIKKRLCAAAKELEIESEVCGLREETGEEPPKAGEPKTDKEGLIAHFGEDTATNLLDLIGEEAYKLLPPRGTRVQQAQEQQGDDYQAFTARCMAAGKAMEQCAEEWKKQHQEAPEKLTEESKETIEALKAQIQVLESQKATLQQELEKAKKPISEAIILGTVTPPSDVLKEIKRLLPERVPMSWGGHYAQLWRNLRNLVKKHESQSQP